MSPLDQPAPLLPLSDMAIIRRTVHRIIGKHGGLSAVVGDDSDLFAAGLDSFGMVRIMLDMEDALGIEFSAAVLNRRSFATVATLCGVIAGLRGRP